jgi:acetolactate synthase-1/2/3 large subunit
MRVADYIVKRLLAAGIQDVFLVTGGGSMHLNDAFSRNKKFKVTCFHHEQSAAIAAESYARSSFRPCALNVTTGPGGINALNGVYGAYVDSIPMFVVSGQVKRETVAASYPNIPLRQLGDQEVDIVSMVRPIVKFVHYLNTKEDVESVMDSALALMVNGRPGPVWIDVPIDIQGAIVSFKHQQSVSKIFLPRVDFAKLVNDPGCTKNTKLELSKPNDTENKYKRALLALKAAKRPVILAGTGVSSPAARTKFTQLLNELNMPFVPGWNALDLVPTGNKNFAGRPGTVGDRAGNFTVQNSDLILVLGCRLNIRQIGYSFHSFAKNAYKIMVDIDEAELDKPTLSIDLKIKTKVEQFLDFLVENISEITQKEHSTYRDWCVNCVKKYPVVLPFYKHQNPLNPYFFLSEFSKILHPKTTVVTGNGAACVMSFQAFEVKFGQRIFTNSGSASMGYDLPAAIGCAIAQSSSNCPIVCIAGDGSIMMNIQELQTISSKELNIKIILLNNGGYLSIRSTQQSYFPDNEFGTNGSNGVAQAEFCKLAPAFGLNYYRIEQWDDKTPILLRQKLETKKPEFIEIIVNPNQGFEPKLASRKNDDGTMTSPELDDMAPFLSRDELENNRNRK